MRKIHDFYMICNFGSVINRHLTTDDTICANINVFPNRYSIAQQCHSANMGSIVKNNIGSNDTPIPYRQIFFIGCMRAQCRPFGRFSNVRSRENFYLISNCNTISNCYMWMNLNMFPKRNTFTNVDKWPYFYIICINIGMNYRKLVDHEISFLLKYHFDNMKTFRRRNFLLIPPYFITFTYRFKQAPIPVMLPAVTAQRFPLFFDRITYIHKESRIIRLLQKIAIALIHQDIFAVAQRCHGDPGSLYMILVHIAPIMNKGCINLQIIHNLFNTLHNLSIIKQMAALHRGKIYLLHT